MNLGLFFRKLDELVRLDFDRLRDVTDEEFLGHLLAHVPDDNVTELQMPEPTNKQRFVYFRIRSSWYSFAYDRREKTLILSHMLQKKWQFIVGYKSI